MHPPLPAEGVAIPPLQDQNERNEWSSKEETQGRLDTGSDISESRRAELPKLTAQTVNLLYNIKLDPYVHAPNLACA